MFTLNLKGQLVAFCQQTYFCVMLQKALLCVGAARGALAQLTRLSSAIATRSYSVGGYTTVQEVPHVMHGREVHSPILL